MSTVHSLRITALAAFQVSLLSLCMTACGGDEHSDEQPVVIIDAAADAPGGADAGDAGDASDADADRGDAAHSDVGPAPDVAQPPEDTHILAHDDDGDSARLRFEDPPGNWHEYVRFEVDRPVRIWSLEVMLHVPRDESVTLYVWDDFGGNRVNMNHAEPLGQASFEATTDQSGQWVEVLLDTPVDLVPGRIFYAGMIVDGEEPVQMMVDAEQQAGEGEVPASLIWLADRPRNSNGTLPLAASPGDFRLRARVEWIDTVAELDRSFEAKPIEEVGLAAFRRIAVADVDGDGDADVMLDGPRLFANDAGSFSDVTSAWIPAGVSSNGGVFGDYDNDGDADFFATGARDRLLRNDGGHFVDVTADSGIDDRSEFACGDGGVQQLPTEAAAWFDYDNDGWIDLYQANYECGGDPGVASADKLWRNLGDGSFELIDLGVEQPQNGRGVAPADADGDGFVDLLVTNYRLDPNFFFANLDGALVESGAQTRLGGVKSTAGGRDWYGHSIGAAWGDVDHDGLLDVFVANLAHPRFIEISQKATLYRNASTDGALAFEDVTEQAGIRYLETPSSPTLFDYDNDGDLDLFFTCVYAGRDSQFYRNDGHPQWTEVSYASGVRVDNGWGAASLDLDADGDLDLLANDRAFINRNLPGENAVFVRLEGAGAGQTNRDAIGARVTAEVGGRLIVRERFGAHGTGVQDSPWLHIGLGQADSVDLKVEFPATGTTVEVADVQAGERIVVREVD